MSIPDEALAPAKEAVEREMRSRTYDRHAYNEEVLLEGVADIALAALEAADTIMLSHELEQTRLAHLDAVVNAQTATRLQHAIDAVLAYGEDRKKAIHEGGKEADAAVKSYAYHMERIITEVLES